MSTITDVRLLALEASLHSTMQDFIKHLRSNGQHTTAVNYAYALRIFWEWLKPQGTDPTSVTAETLRAYQRWQSGHCLRPRGASPSAKTQSARLEALRSYYRFMNRRGLTLADVSRELRMPKTRKYVTKRDFLTLQETTALLQTQAKRTTLFPHGNRNWALEVRNLAYFSLAVATGRRMHGLADLTVGNLDFEHNEIRVEREKGKTGRVLPVAQWAMLAAKEYIEKARPLFATAPETDLLFVNWKAARASGDINDTLDALRKQTAQENPDLEELAGKRVTMHCLRVTFAKLLFNGGCNFRSINELMLHDRLSSTAYYIPIPLEDLRSACRQAHPRA